MAAIKTQDEGQMLATPSGKMLGIVETQANLESLSASLKAAGFTEIKYLVGEEGVTLLERVNGFFFSDMEERVLARHIAELRSTIARTRRRALMQSRPNCGSGLQVRLWKPA